MTRGSRNKSRKRSLCAASDLRSNHPQLGPKAKTISSAGAEARGLCAGAGAPYS